MREICVKTKPSGVGMTGYAQMVTTLRQCANATQKQTHYKHTKILCMCSALIYKEKTMSKKVLQYKKNIFVLNYKKIWHRSVSQLP